MEKPSITRMVDGYRVFGVTLEVRHRVVFQILIWKWNFVWYIHAPEED